MILQNFERLFITMNKMGEKKQKFTICYNSIRAHVLFLADIEPFLLIFGIQDTNEYLELEMSQGFEVNSFFTKELYLKLIEIFNIQYDPNHKFTPNDFLSFINNNVPEFRKTERVKNSDILRYKRNIEEADKIHFCGWIYHNTKSNATPANLEKTRLLMGEVAYKRCCERNISSKWTDLIERKTDPDFKNFLA